MVSDTKGGTTQVFDRMNDSFRTAFEQGRKTQDAWFKTLGEAWTRVPNDGQRVVGDWVPFFGRQVETAAQAYDVSLRSGLDVFKAACDATMRPGETDPYETTRNFWDTAFGAARSNFDAMGQAGARAIEECANFCDSFWRQETAGKRPAGQPATGPKAARSSD